MDVTPQPREGAESAADEPRSAPFGNLGSAPQAKAAEPVQLSLLHGFPDRAPMVPGKELAAANPVAQVRIESGLPHLDRPFDYSVPTGLDDLAQPGVRVKVKFNGQELPGYLVGRSDTSTSGQPLVALHKVISGVPVLAPQILQLAESVAARYAGTLSDVLRVAVPPRVARLDKEYLAAQAAASTQTAGPSTTRPEAAVSRETPGVFQAADAHQPAHPWAGYVHGAAFLRHLAAGESPRAAVSILQGYGTSGWAAALAAAVAAVRTSGRGAVVVVPDYRDLDQLEKALLEVLPAADIARLNADDGPSVRYGNFLRLRSGQARVAIGTRGASYAPVKNLGFVACWDDGDDLHTEQRAPYAHTREVLLLRAEQEQVACLFAAHSRSTEVQRLVDAGWLQSVAADRQSMRRSVPRVLNTADSFELERDPLARMARLPGAAWRAAQDGLRHGPVLIQVARAGYAPSLLCENCREPARCLRCQGPLAIAGGAAVAECRWCSTPEPHWQCAHCSGRQLRRGATGVIRTAEELGRAFPGATVVTSTGDAVKASVGSSSALVVATVGAEPIAAGGYAAALLLDGDSLLRRENLRAAEDTVRRWFNAASLVRPQSEGGLVVITAEDAASVGALLRWDPAGFAGRELALRRELQLPPAVRLASLTGTSAAVEQYTVAITGRLESAGVHLRTAGPAPVVLRNRAVRHSAAEESSDDVRTLFFIPFVHAKEVTAIMRAIRSAQAAKRTSEPVQIRLDGSDVL